MTTARRERATASRTVGLRVKSGYAIAVVLSGSKAAPTPVARTVVALSDPERDETKQPYHNRMFTHEEDAAAIERRVRVVKQCAKKAVAAFVAEHGPARAALVVGSLIDPATVGNPHIRAHAHEGRLFRTVLSEALESKGVRCDVIVDKTLGAAATKRLGRSTSQLGRTLATFGKTLGSPWRADEKSAATAAWLVL